MKLLPTPLLSTGTMMRMMTLKAGSIKKLPRNEVDHVHKLLCCPSAQITAIKEQLKLIAATIVTHF